MGVLACHDKTAMAYIFMDESGDLWFDDQKNNSNYFLVTFVFCRDTKPLHKTIKTMISWLSKKGVKLSSWVLHATKEKPTTRVKLLRLCASHDIAIMTICLNKSKVYTRLHNEKHILYNYIVNILLWSIITKKLIPLDNPIQFIASRRETNKILNENFLSYLHDQSHKQKAPIQFSIKTPSEEKCLQVTDFLSRALYQKHERNNEEYYEIIKSLVVEEKWLF